MSIVRQHASTRWVCSGVAMLILALATTAISADDVVLVANGGVGESSISSQEAQDVFLGKKSSWSDGSTIVLATLSGGSVHDAFLKTFVGRTASQFATYWKKLAFSGKAMEPKAFDTEAELIKFVAEHKGAVGYVSAKVSENKDAIAGCKILGK